MELLIYLYGLIDSALMPFYRFPDNPLLGYYLGTFALSFASIIIGEYSISLAFHANSEMIKSDNQKIDHFQSLSLEALKAGDKTAFKACNGIANEAYGKSFFTQITLSAASLWPVFIALGWMQYRFSEVSFQLSFTVPLYGDKLGYFANFLLCYILMRITVKNIRQALLNYSEQPKQVSENRISQC
jgi:hypothetical protein